MTKLEAAELIRGLIENCGSISIRDAAVSNELAGKLAKNRYVSIEWDAGKPGWRFSATTWEGYRDESEVWEVLSTGEDWKHAG